MWEILLMYSANYDYKFIAVLYLCMIAYHAYSLKFWNDKTLANYSIQSFGKEIFGGFIVAKCP